MKRLIIVLGSLFFLLTSCAIFISKSYNVTLYFNGDSVVYTVKEGEHVNLSDLAYEKEGYTFLGFYDGDFLVDIENIAIKKNYTLTAKYQINTYVITFNYDGATSSNNIASKTVTYNSALGELPTPAKEGYNFDGWFDSQGTSYNSTTFFTQTANITLIAHWSAASNLVVRTHYYFENIDDDFFTIDDTLTVTSSSTFGSSIVASPITKEGFIFDSINPSNVLSGVVGLDGLELKVYYKRIRYSITFLYNSSETADTTVSKKYGYVYSSIDEPVKENYTFAGWFLDSNYSTPLNLPFSVTSDLTIYTKWIFGDAYTIHFKTNIIDQSLFPNYNIIVPANEPISEPTVPLLINERYYIEGWYELDSPNVYKSIAYDFSTPITQSLTLYAKWSDHGISDLLTGQTGASTSFVEGVNFASQLSLDSSVYTVLAYKSTGTTIPVYQNSEGEIRLYRGSTGSGSGNYLEISSTNIINQITIHYSSAAYALNALVLVGSLVVTPSISGLDYTYIINSSFFTIKNSTDSGDQVRFKTILFESLFTSLSPYLSYYGDDTVNTVSGDIYFKDGALNIPPYVSTIWSSNSAYIDADGVYSTPEPGAQNLNVVISVTITTNGIETIVNFSLTLRPTYYVYFYQGTTIINGLTQIVPSGRTIDNHDAPTIAGYEFVGWYTSSDFQTAFNFESVVSGTTNIYGLFDIVVTQYLVTFYDQFSSVLFQETIDYNGLVSEPSSSITTIDGYTFIGWFSDSARVNPFDFSTHIISNTSIYGLWEVIQNYDDIYTYSGNYYNGINFSSSASTLRSSLHSLLQTYTKKSYGDVRWILEQSDSIDYEIVSSLPSIGIVGKFYLVPNGIHYRIYEFDRGVFNYQGDSAFNFQIVSTLPSPLSNQVYYLIKNGNNYDVYYNSTVKALTIPYTANPEVVWGIYDNSLIIAGWPSSNGNVTQSGQSGSGIVGTWKDSYNYSREHVWCNSKLGVASMDNSDRNQGSDAHNLRAIKQSINSSRSNRYYEENNTSYTPYTIGSDAFYPGNAFKGDVARILMYMDIMYEGHDNGVNLQITNNLPDLVNNSATNYTEAGAYMGLLRNMVRWSIEDPVDSFEIARNNFIYSIQGNRNPFIDLPNLSILIYGQPIPKQSPRAMDFVLLLISIETNIILERKYNYTF
jgi:uncharacterized repeat protein (TIGR02543 family)